jgi:ATP-dependent RNA helicase RhlE
MSFTSLGLAEALVHAVADQGYTEPTPIQLQAIPAVLAGSDLLAGAQTGTGKTAAFVLPLLHLLSHRRTAHDGARHRAVRALILTPTRELAAQVEESVRVYGKYLRLTSMAMYGGVGIHPQIAQLKRGVDIVVATPGRLLDHLGQRTLDLSHVEVLILDEADRMLDMGFIRDIRRVLAVLPARRQNLLFSATFSDDIRTLAEGLLTNPLTIDVAPRNATVEGIAQRVHPVDRERKRELLSHLIGQNQWHQVLVFTRTKHGANKLALQLNQDGITALAIHGNKSQAARTRALSEFKDGRLQVLVATDIAARGIDIDELPHVVNYDLPNVPEDYVHRIGRTGRAGANGEALSLVCVDETAFLRDIERLLHRALPREIIAGFEPDPHAVARPVTERRNGPTVSFGHRGAPATAVKRGAHAPPQPSTNARHGGAASLRAPAGGAGGALPRGRSPAAPAPRSGGRPPASPSAPRARLAAQQRPTGRGR